MNATLGPAALAELASRLQHLSAEDIRREAIRLQNSVDDLAWWQATITVDRQVRNAHVARSAAAAARAARDAVLAAARRASMTIDADVIAVARSAADTARAIVAGHPHSNELFRMRPLGALVTKSATQHPHAA